MLKPAKYRFRTFTVEIRERPIPDSYLVIFAGGMNVDYSGYETAAGDRKKMEDDFRFMWNPYDAPSNKKGEYVMKFSSEERLKRFTDWLDNQIRQYGGLNDDI